MSGEVAVKKQNHPLNGVASGEEVCCCACCCLRIQITEDHWARLSASTGSGVGSARRSWLRSASCTPTTSGESSGVRSTFLCRLFAAWRGRSGSGFATWWMVFDTLSVCPRRTARLGTARKPVSPRSRANPLRKRLANEEGRCQIATPSLEPKCRSRREDAFSRSLSRGGILTSAPRFMVSMRVQSWRPGRSKYRQATDSFGAGDV